MPLLPIHSLLVAVLLEDLRVGGMKSLSRFSPVRQEWARPVAGVFLLLLAAVNLWPQSWLEEIRLLGVFGEYTGFHLQQESWKAIRCLDPGSKVMSNCANLFYFYSKGEHRVFKSRPLAGEGGPLPMKRTNWPRKRTTSPLSPPVEEVARRAKVKEALQRAGIHQTAVFLRDGEGTSLLEVMESLREDRTVRAVVRCQDRGFVVYDVVNNNL